MRLPGKSVATCRPEGQGLHIIGYSPTPLWLCAEVCCHFTQHATRRYDWLPANHESTCILNKFTKRFKPVLNRFESLTTYRYLFT
jgi:hypothetical protein